MSKYLFSLFVSVFSILTLNGQSVKLIEPNFQDYISLLNTSGYEVFSFDISELRDTTYIIEMVVKEYVSDKDEPISSRNINPWNNMKNRNMIQDFMWRELTPEEMDDIKRSSVDFDKGIYSYSEKISVGFIPVKNDSIETVQIDVENIGSVRFNLNLRSILNEVNNTQVFTYGVKPFKTSSFKPNTFIPLALYGSYWYDDQYKIVRFCGENEIDPDMKAEILKDMPHYYIIGVIFRTN